MIGNYSGIFLTLCNNGIFRTLDIQNTGMFKTRGIFRTLIYPKFWHIQNQRVIQNPGIFESRGILKVLTNICDGAL